MLLPKFNRSEFMDKKHLANIRLLPSVLSHREPCEPHHLRIKQERGVGLKATDRWAIPLTHEEHMAVHMVGSKREEEWFAAKGIACYAIAYSLWANRGDLEAMRKIILTCRR